MADFPVHAPVTIVATGVHPLTIGHVLAQRQDHHLIDVIVDNGERMTYAPDELLLGHYAPCDACHGTGRPTVNTRWTGFLRILIGDHCFTCHGTGAGSRLSPEF